MTEDFEPPRVVGGKEPEVVHLNPGDVLELTGVAGPDGIVLDLGWEESAG